MNYYCDITLLPNPEANIGFLWQKVFSRIHLAFVENKQQVIAASFPEYGSKTFPLGSKLRLIAESEEVLSGLSIPERLKLLRDYCHCTSPREIPPIQQFARFKRKQFHSNVERKARRRARKSGKSFEEAMKDLSNCREKQSNLPYINLESSSTSHEHDRNHQFKLFIDREFVNKPSSGNFNCYGLSNEATVPWF